MGPTLIGSFRKSSKKETPRRKLVLILLDSGLGGDLMFYKKGTCKFFLYSTRQLPKSWLTSNGTFTTYGKGSIQVNFFEYSKSKEVTVTPYIIQYGKDTENKPAFDLILGTKTLNELVLF